MTQAQLGAQTSAAIDGLAALVLVPLGATEQHGPHLPLDTDTRVAVEVATRAAQRCDALVAPAIGYGASGEHEGFPGTISIGSQVLRDLLVEFGRSACRWAPRILFVNGHGGNLSALADAVSLLRYEGRDAAWFACAPTGGDAHAGHTETSMLLSFAPQAVDTDAAVPGVTAPLPHIIDDLRRGGTVAVSPTGILGDPTTATAEDGEQIMAALVDDLAAAAVGWTPDERGRVR
ncbi:mycofactocin biosynthesis peptidyl-dipeptidase MftE [Gordonia crocea]|uniref:Mycofactocin system creatininase family protein n=1 Tax=Gordonia crocea TaxID=589162 RepID=A0A7I9V2X5_9ACTN|nr:mycofactocin biosynthesis peptidyl-dipeptidase MftE [Gordonia crocea]GED99390.1 mycofactocin system creatininase family protein [Gordonia crocea]